MSTLLFQRIYLVTLEELHSIEDALDNLEKLAQQGADPNAFPFGSPLTLLCFTLDRYVDLEEDEVWERECVLELLYFLLSHGAIPDRVSIQVCIQSRQFKLLEELLRYTETTELGQIEAHTPELIEVLQGFRIPVKATFWSGRIHTIVSPLEYYILCYVFGRAEKSDLYEDLCKLCPVPNMETIATIIVANSDQYHRDRLCEMQERFEEMITK